MLGTRRRAQLSIPRFWGHDALFLVVGPVPQNKHYKAQKFLDPSSTLWLDPKKPSISDPIPLFEATMRVLVRIFVALVTEKPNEERNETVTALTAFMQVYADHLISPLAVTLITGHALQSNYL